MMKTEEVVSRTYGSIVRPYKIKVSQKLGNEESADASELRRQVDSGRKSSSERNGIELQIGECPTQQVPHFCEHVRTLLASSAAALGAVAQGTTTGYSSPAIPDLNSGKSLFRLNEMEVSLVASVFAIGACFGALIGGFLLDRFGRKCVMIVTTMPFAVGWTVIAISPNVYCLCFGRFLTGFCSGVMDVGVPVYISEIAAPSIRGFMGSFFELGTNLGFLFVFGFGCVLRWNWLAVACLCLPVLQIFCMLPMPESPRWLLLKGRRREGLETLRWLRGGEGADVAAEVAEIEEHVRQSINCVQCREFLQPTVYKPLAIILGLLFFQQASGDGVIPEYLVSIFASAESTLDPYVQTATFGAIGFASTLASAFLVDRTGRRVMLYVSSVIMALSMAGLASFFTVKSLAPDFSDGFLVWLPAVLLIMYNFGVAMGYGPIPFYMTGEILPMRFRGLGAGISIAFLWLFTFLFCLAFPSVLLAFGDQEVYWLMTAFCILSLPFTFFFVPETRGKSLEEIEERFKKRTNS